MDRGEFLRLATLGALSPLALAVSGQSVVGVDSPNIVLIITDDQPYHTAGLKPGRSGSGGASDYWMPKLHTYLRAQGIDFENAYVGTPLCAPSRASILTGLYTHNHRVVVNQASAERYRKRRLASRSIPAMLRDNSASEAGYKSALFGKLLNHYKQVAPWIPPGFERRIGGSFVCSLNNSEPLHVNANGKVGWAKWANGNRVKPKDEVRWLTDRFLAWLSKAQEPYFAMLTASSPHTPSTPSDAHRGEFATVQKPLLPSYDHYDPNKPRHILSQGPLTAQEAAEMETRWRGAMEELQDVDDAIERVCTAVDFETTYVFFCSDNGYHTGEHRWRGKSQPYDESTKTPLLVRGPGITPETKDSHLVSLVDLGATILELGGVDTQALETERGISLDGRSLSPLMFTFPEAGGAEVPEPGEAWRNTMLIESVKREPADRDILTAWSALRTENSLYVEHDTGEREYYDLANDPYQLTSLQNDPQNADELFWHSERLAALRGAAGEELRSAEIS
jgi:N-acetylglucosamine-6-sulfatase